MNASRCASHERLALLPARSLEEAGARAVFTTRLGGVSLGPYTSLNLAYTVGDAPEAVTENRQRVARAIGVRTQDLVGAEQVHGGAAAIVGPGDRGRTIAGVDALATDAPDIWLAVYAADCVPVLLVDPARRVVAAVHAGWRGVAAEVVLATVRLLAEAFGTRPGDLRAALGPAIGGCCYEVDAPVARAMERAPWWACSARSTGPDTWRLDLRAAIRRQFEITGVPPRRIDVSPECTRCRPDLFFSYRRDRITGRMAACIRLRG
jgi:YfiH family protein